jgi:hypothetical protein
MIFNFFFKKQTEIIKIGFKNWLQKTKYWRKNEWLTVLQKRLLLNWIYQQTIAGLLKTEY